MLVSHFKTNSVPFVYQIVEQPSVRFRSFHSTGIALLDATKQRVYMTAIIFKVFKIIVNFKQLGPSFNQS